jgi:hypothetical protein
MWAIKWCIENRRAVGVGAACVAVLVGEMSHAASSDVVSDLTTIMSVLEVAMFAVAFAVYFDGEDKARGVCDIHALESLVAWFVGASFVAWGNVVLVRTGIAAYAAFGVPPVWPLGL